MQSITAQSCLSATDTVLILRACGIKSAAIDNFLAQDVTTNLWIDLTHDLLKELGVAAFGPRLKLLTWIYLTMVPVEQQDIYRVWAARKVDCVWFLPSGSQRLRSRPPADCDLLSMRQHDTLPPDTPTAKDEAYHNCSGEYFEANVAIHCDQSDRYHQIYSDDCCDQSVGRGSIGAAIVAKDSADALKQRQLRIDDESSDKVVSLSVKKAGTGVKVSRASREMFDVLFSIVCANGATPTKPKALAKLFAERTGTSLERVFGRDWLTDVKSDPRLHYDGQDILAIKSVLHTPKARNIAR